MIKIITIVLLMAYVVAMYRWIEKDEEEMATNHIIDGSLRDEN